MDYRKPRKSSGLTTIVVVLLVVGVAAFVCWRVFKSGGSPGNPVVAITGIPDSWTHKELAEHFEKKGLNLKMLAAADTAVFFTVEGTESATSTDKARNAWQAKSLDSVYCRIYKSSQEAKDAAGPFGPEAFASGRFVFRGNDKALDRLRSTLP